MKLDAYEKELLQLDDDGQISVQSPDPKEKEAPSRLPVKPCKKTNELISVCPAVIFSPLREKRTALACLIKPSSPVFFINMFPEISNLPKLRKPSQNIARKTVAKIEKLRRRPGLDD